MLKPRTRWELEQPSHDKVEALAGSLNVPMFLAKLLVSRGLETVESAKRFLHGKLEDFHDPFLLDGMQESVERIHKAIESGERILVFGDYDADGVSSTSVMYFALKELKANFDYYIPNRFTEGYGPNEPALRAAKESGFSLVITVDTGISAVHEAAVAREIGLDMIVTDHHEPPPVLPDAYSIVNPKKPGCPYPFKGLAGVGVALKMAHALLGQMPAHLLDIACIGTIADLVPLMDENRLIAREGIKALERTEKPGLLELLRVSGLEGKELNEEHVGFAIGPRVNAAGRLDSAVPAVELFTAETREQAAVLAESIDSLNKERQEIVNEITKEAVEIVESEFPPDEYPVLVIAKENWNPGVIGIVASRLVEKYYRPAIVLSIDSEKGLAKGSARSIKGFDMFENLSESRDILPHFGGHPMAAGMTLNMNDVDELRERLIHQAFEQLTEEDFQPMTAVDFEIEIDEMTLETAELIARLSPFGVGNPAPKACIRSVAIREMKKIGSQSNHLKMQLGEQTGMSLDCIGFFKGSLVDELTPYSKVSVVGQISVNEWNGIRKPQLMLNDIAVLEWQLFDLRGIRTAGERIKDLPQEESLFIAFSEEAAHHFSISSQDVRLWRAYEKTSVPELTGKYAVFLDTPSSLAEFQQWLDGAGQPSRIYALFYQQSDQFFSSIPTREQFRWYYAFLLKRQTFHLQQQGEELAKWKGWTKETVNFMSKVFFELDFVTIENGVITVNPQPAKKDLDSSPAYRTKHVQAELESQLVYSSYQTLKDWFAEQTHSKTRF